MSTAFPPSAWIWPFLHKNRPSPFIIDDSACFVNQESEVQEKKVTTLTQAACPLSRACARQLSQRESPWQAGSLPTGRLRPDKAQKGRPCYRGQARLCTTSPSRLRRATSPCRRGFGSPRKVNGFARGSPTRGAVERSETERLYEGKPDREPPAGLPSSVIASQCHCPGCGSQRLLRCRLHPAGRGPNSDSLFPPLAAVVAVAPRGRGTGEPGRPTPNE